MNLEKLESDLKLLRSDLQVLRKESKKHFFQLYFFIGCCFLAMALSGGPAWF